MKRNITRRTFLQLSTLAASSLYLNSDLFCMNNHEKKLLNIMDDNYHFTLGEFKCICFNDGGLNYKPSDFFNNVPTVKINEVLKKHDLPLESIYTPYTHLFVNTGKHRILVDMGAGKVIPNNGNLPISMRNVGIKPEDIDYVFITHAHPDHIGGTLDASGKPVYPNAKYYIWRKEWDFWFSDSASELTNKFFIKVAREQLSPIKKRIIFLDEESEVLPAVSVLSAPGHTPGHMVVVFNSGKEKLYYVADTVLYPLHLEYPDWLPVYDILPEEAALSKSKIFNLVSEEEALVIGQHFTPFPSLGKVVKKEKGWLWVSSLEN